MTKDCIRMGRSG